MYSYTQTVKFDLNVSCEFHWYENAVNDTLLRGNSMHLKIIALTERKVQNRISTTNKNQKLTSL